MKGPSSAEACGRRPYTHYGGQPRGAADRHGGRTVLPYLTELRQSPGSPRTVCSAREQSATKSPTTRVYVASGRRGPNAPCPPYPNPVDDEPTKIRTQRNCHSL